MGLVLQILAATRYRSKLKTWHLGQKNTNRGAQEKRADVVAKCILSEPRHGETWQSVAKDPKNAGKGFDEILKTVVTKLE